MTMCTTEDKNQLAMFLNKHKVAVLSLLVVLYFIPVIVFLSGTIQKTAWVSSIVVQNTYYVYVNL